MRRIELITVIVSILSGFDSIAATLTNTSATLNGSVNPAGVMTSAWFEWGIGSRFDQTTPLTALGSGTGPVGFTADITGLDQGLAYSFRTIASNNLGAITRSEARHLLAPILTINGSNPLTNQWGTAYIEPGANAISFPVSIAAGRAHTVVLRGDNTVSAWGDNSLKQTNSPLNATNIIAIAAGQNHTVAARANGTVVAWGQNTSAQTNIIAQATNVIAVAAGESFCLALRTNGTAIGWGDNFYGQTTPPTGSSNIIAIAAGQRHALALNKIGSIIAWGFNAYGQTNVPITATNSKAIAAGAGHSIALKTDGSVLAWGLNSYLQTNVPMNATNIVEIAAGYYHNLALRADGTVIAWGAGTNNTGANPHYGQSIVPSTATNCVAITSGYYNSFAMRDDGSIIGWGAGVTNSGSFPNQGQSIPPTGLEYIFPTVFSGGSIDTNQPGSYPIGYTTTNAFGGVATASRTVIVTAPPPPPALTSSLWLADGSFRFSFTNVTPINFTVIASTNVALPTSSWTVLGSALMISPGTYQFTDIQATNFARRFYQVKSP